MSAEDLARLIDRASTPAKRLEAPGPSRDEIEQMVRAAATAPDHGQLHPWRFLLIPSEQRQALARLFEDASRRINPEGTPEAHARAGEKAMNAPTVVAVIARLRPQQKGVPVREQYASVGAAIAQFLLAADALGYGAIMLSGARTLDPEFCAALGVIAPEELMGFLSVGSVAEARKPKRRPPVEEILSVWPGLPEP